MVTVSATTTSATTTSATTTTTFYENFKLMIWNRFAFNLTGTTVSQAGIKLQRVFDEKWRGLPSLHEHSEVESDDDENSEVEHLHINLVFSSLSYHFLFTPMRQ